jgi:hypothetical protein
MQFFLYKFVPFLAVILTVAFLYTLSITNIYWVGILIKLFIIIIYSVLIFGILKWKMFWPIWIWKTLLWYSIFQIVIFAIVLPVTLQTFPDVMKEAISEPTLGYKGLVNIYIWLVPSMIMQFFLLTAYLFNITPKIK